MENISQSIIDVFCSEFFCSSSLSYLVPSIGISYIDIIFMAPLGFSMYVLELSLITWNSVDMKYIDLRDLVCVCLG